jgi:hypothetical protein
MTMLRSTKCATRRGAQRGPSWAPGAIVAAALAACGGCQVLVPNGLPRSLAFSEDARIAKQAKADSFPTPADVGLAPTSVAP